MLNNKNIRILLGVLGVVLLGYILWNVRTIIIYFFAAAIIAFVARPLMRLLGKVKIKEFELPNWLKSALVLACFIFIMFGAVQMLIPTVLTQADIISQIDTNLLLERLQPQMDAVMKWAKKANINEVELEEMLRSEINKIFTIGDIGSYIKGFISGLADSLIAAFSVLFISFFLIKDGNIVDNVVASLTPDKYLDKIKTIFNDTKNLLSRYFIGVIIQISIIITVVSIGLMLLGVKNALFIGVLAGIFNIIPYVGPLLGGTIGISLAITSQLEHIPDLNIVQFGLLAIIPFTVAQLLDNFVLQPLIFSKSVRAHPLEIFIVILAAGNLGGVVGMIVAVPVYSFLRIVAREFFNGYKVVQGLTKNI
jgi:predicted PurR-regulated permease PerM